MHTPHPKRKAKPRFSHGVFAIIVRTRPRTNWKSPNWCTLVRVPFAPAVLWTWSISRGKVKIRMEIARRGVCMCVRGLQWRLVFGCSRAEYERFAWKRWNVNYDVKIWSGVKFYLYFVCANAKRDLDKFLVFWEKLMKISSLIDCLVCRKFMRYSIH